MHEGVEGSIRRSWFAAAGAVAATYVYFLIFAEFAFLELARAIAPGDLRGFMLVLGAGGMAGAGLGAWWFRRAHWRALLAWQFRACAASALLALGARQPAALALVALFVGLSLGSVTVTLSAALPRATAGKRLGLAVGLGTGLAYAGCNLPFVFQAGAAMQTIIAAGCGLVASLLVGWMRDDDTTLRETAEFRGTLALSWVVALLALVWMDSAAFFIIQHSPALRDATWSETGMLLGNAAVHGIGGLLAGSWVDRGGRGPVVVGAALLLATACALLNGVLPSWIPPSCCYAAGVSLYSTVLVEYPARSGRVWLAALTFAVAGWLGSALGIGMAQDLARVPNAFVIVAVAVVAAAGLWRWRVLRRVVAVGAVLGVATLQAETSGAELLARGREVYISEGCIHCHSQFIRPKASLEVERWGPGYSLERGRNAAPPLFGTRRQGPDLSQVGNRRTLEWNRLHLMEPRAISPGSKMPSYAHLFGPGDSRGDALVHYLASLGADTRRERQAMIANWAPRGPYVLPPTQAALRFQQLCLPCHGPAGHGDGPLAGRLSIRAPDWSREGWRRIPPGEDMERSLSRIIKFGLEGAPMAGHEYLPDGDVVGLARHVRTLQAGRSGGPAAVAVRP